MLPYLFVKLVVCVALTGTIVLSEPLEFIVRKTIYGKIRGYVHTVLENTRVERFLGIPYAAPPTGNLRFENPQEPTGWADILNTTMVPPACPQKFFYMHNHVPDFNYSNEDCLYLNIYVPKTGDYDGDKAVLVHIHGGSNNMGMGAMFHGDVLAAMGNIIVVTFNYRLGPFGFLSGGDAVFPGNYGLFDQNFALQWVQKNIHFFGGNPVKVTVEGHSAGSGDVGFHILSPKSKGLFRYAIMQSGSPTAYWALSPPTGNPVTLMESFDTITINCSFHDMYLVKQCLKNIDTETIIEEEDKFLNWKYGGFYTPVIDNVFINDTPEHLIENSTLNGEAFMMGITRDEGVGLVYVPVKVRIFSEITESFISINRINNLEDCAECIDAIVQEYYPWSDPKNESANTVAIWNFAGDVTLTVPAIDVAKRLSQRNKDIYFYSFDYYSTLSSPPVSLGVPHGRDLFYLFGCPFTGHPLYNYTDEDRAVSRMFIDMWSNFVKNGKPSFSSFVADPIPRFSSNDQLYMKISGFNGKATLTIGSRPRARQVNFWTYLVPKIAKRGQLDKYVSLGNNTNSEITVGTLGWVFIALAGFLFVLVIVLIGCVVHYKKKTHMT